MPISADEVRLAEVPETAFGETPANPTFQVIRLTGESLVFTPTTTNSQAMNPNRSVEDSILTGGAVAGSINFELAKEAWFEEFLSGAMCSDWDAESLKVGTILKSFTIEKTLPLDEVDSDYHGITGAIMNGFSLTIAPNAAITGSFEILAKDYGVTHAVITGGTYTDPVFNPIFTAPLVTDIEISAIAAAAQCFNNITLTLNNNARALECIGHLGAREMNLGRAEVTLAFSLYYADGDLLDDLTDQTEMAISFTVNDSDDPSNSYTFTLPRAKLTQCNVVAGGTGQDVVADCVATGLYDPVTDTPLLVSRATATAPAPPAPAPDPESGPLFSPGSPGSPTSTTSPTTSSPAAPAASTTARAPARATVTP